MGSSTPSLTNIPVLVECVSQGESGNIQTTGEKLAQQHSWEEGKRPGPTEKPVTFLVHGSEQSVHL